MINDGLRYYEDDLVNDNLPSSMLSTTPGGSGFSTVNLITKEHFEKMAPPRQLANNPEICPPPPPPFNTPMIGGTTAAMQRGAGEEKKRRHHRTHKRGNQARFYPAPQGGAVEQQESNVGWIMDKRQRRQRTTSTR